MIKLIKFLLCLFLYVFFYCCSYGAIVNIDPGAIGESFKDKIIPFTDINGHLVVGGNSISPLEFVFTGNKNITVNTNNDAFLQAEVSINYSISQSSGFFPATSGVLKDSEDNILLNSWSTGSSTVGGGNAATFIVLWADFVTPQIDGLIFSRLRFNSIGFPFDSLDRGVITGASLRLRYNGSSGESLIGINQSENEVPEPLSLIMFFISLLPLCLYSKKR